MVITADSNDYMTWQIRCAYYWFRKAAAMPGSQLGGFTRILHTGQARRRGAAPPRCDAARRRS